MNTQTVESVFARSWQLLASNWVIVVPGIVIGIIGGIIRALFTPTLATGAATVGGLGALGALVALVVVLALTIAQIAYTTGMAGAAWERGTTTLADGTRAFERDAGNITVAMIAMWLVGLCAAFLSIFTFGLAFVAYFFFFIYTMPAAVVGERGGLTAMSESYRIALARPGPTAVMGVLIVVLAIITEMVSFVLRVAPFIGPIIAGIIFQALVAYITLVVVGEYLALRGAGMAGTQPPPVA